MLKCSIFLTSPELRRPLHCPEEALQLLERVLGTFFLEEMAAIKAAPGNSRGRFHPPGRKDVPQRPYGSPCPPEGVNRCHDLVAARDLRRSCGSNHRILAGPVRRPRNAPRASVPLCARSRESRGTHAEGARAVLRLCEKQGWSLRSCEPQCAESRVDASLRYPLTASVAARAKDMLFMSTDCSD
jgi:hypothetical protein